MALRSTFSRDDGPSTDDRLKALESQMDRLKVMYEQYFMGIQKMAPSHLHREVERAIRDLTQNQIRNTALRFRFNTLSQRYGSLNTYWRRILREIEQGRYVRDLNRLSRKAMREGTDIPEEVLAAMPKLMRKRIMRDRERISKVRARKDGQDFADEPTGEREAVIRDTPQKPAPSNVHSFDEDDPLLQGDLNLDDVFSSLHDAATAPASPPASPRANQKTASPPPVPTKPVTPMKPAARAKQARQANKRATSGAGKAAPPGMSEKETRELFDRYVEARKMVGESTKNLTYDRLLKTLNKQAPQIMKAHGASGVRFRVEIKDDSVVLKAKPKK